MEIAWLAELWLHKDINLEMLPTIQWIFTCLSKTVIKTLKQNKKFVQNYEHVY